MASWGNGAKKRPAADIIDLERQMIRSQLPSKVTKKIRRMCVQPHPESAPQSYNQYENDRDSSQYSLAMGTMPANSQMGQAGCQCHLMPGFNAYAQTQVMPCYSCHQALYQPPKVRSLVGDSQQGAMNEDDDGSYLSCVSYGQASGQPGTYYGTDGSLVYHPDSEGQAMQDVVADRLLKKKVDAMNALLDRIDSANPAQANPAHEQRATRAPAWPEVPNTKSSTPSWPDVPN